MKKINKFYFIAFVFALFVFPSASFAVSAVSSDPIVTPSLVVNSTDALARFESASGISASTLKTFLTTLIIILSLFFSGIQILLFWMDALEKGDKHRTSNFISATFYSVRSFLVSVILINLILNT